MNAFTRKVKTGAKRSSSSAVVSLVGKSICFLAVIGLVTGKSIGIESTPTVRTDYGRRPIEQPKFRKFSWICICSTFASFLFPNIATIRPYSFATSRTPEKPTNQTPLRRPLALSLTAYLVLRRKLRIKRILPFQMLTDFSALMRSGSSWVVTQTLTRNSLHKTYVEEPTKQPVKQADQHPYQHPDQHAYQHFKNSLDLPKLI